MRRIHLFISVLWVLTVAGCEEKEQASNQENQGGGAAQTYWTSSGVVLAGSNGSASGAYVERLEVEVVAGVSMPTEGYHRVRAKIKRGYDLYAGRDVKFLPMMYGHDHPVHSCPVEQPNGPSEDGYYYGAVFFMRPNMPNHHWKIHVIIGERDTTTFVLDVAQHPWNGVRPGDDFTPIDSFSYFYEVVPLKSTDGFKDAVFLIYRRDRNQPVVQPSAFLPANNITQIDLQARIPNTGHSVGSGIHTATPTSGRPGRFTAKKVFDKAGFWELILTCKEGETVVLRDTLHLIIGS
ncbi:MAG: hypothetical protein ABDH66_06145 [Bacteroidia bacterium]